MYHTSKGRPGQSQHPSVLRAGFFRNCVPATIHQPHSKRDPATVYQSRRLLGRLYLLKQS